MESYEQYKNTVLWYFEKYHDSSIFKFDENQINELALFLKIEVKDIKKALASPVEKSLCDCDWGEYHFNTLARAFLIRTQLDYIDQGVKDDAENMLILISHIRTCQHHMSMLNSDISTYMCMTLGKFTRDYAVQDWSGYVSDSVLNYLEMLYREDLVYDNLSEINCIVNTISYDMATRINTIYLLGVLLVMENSPFLDDEIKNVAKDLYLYLIKTFKNSRLVGININSSPVQMKDKPGERGRLANSTRIMIVYSYDNYDAYCLRLDLPHKGIEFVHYNNRSPGDGHGTEVESCVYSEKDYLEVLMKHNDIPRLKEFFIEYSGIFALKERCNCTFLDDREKQVFDKLEKEHSHAFISKNQYTEETIEAFVQVFSYFFASSCLKPIDADYEFAQSCFNCNKLMFDFQLLILSRMHLSPDTIKSYKYIDMIVERAIRYRLFDCNESEKEEWKNINGVYLIIDDILKNMPKIL